MRVNGIPDIRYYLKSVVFALNKSLHFSEVNFSFITWHSQVLFSNFIQLWKFQFVWSNSHRYFLGQSSFQLILKPPSNYHRLFFFFFTITMWPFFFHILQRRELYTDRHTLQRSTTGQSSFSPYEMLKEATKLERGVMIRETTQLEGVTMIVMT